MGSWVGCVEKSVSLLGAGAITTDSASVQYKKEVLGNFLLVTSGLGTAGYNLLDRGHPNTQGKYVT